jgi:hypothetical protein
MEVQVFIRGRKTLLRDSLSRAICRVCTTLSTVIVDKGAGRVARFERAASSAPLVKFFECQRRIFLKFFALPNPQSQAKVSAV